VTGNSIAVTNTFSGRYFRLRRHHQGRTWHHRPYWIEHRPHRTGANDITVNNGLLQLNNAGFGAIPGSVSFPTTSSSTAVALYGLANTFDISANRVADLVT